MNPYVGPVCETRRWLPLLPSSGAAHGWPLWAVTVTLALLLLPPQPARAADFDGDNQDDAWETFFGLDTNNAADGALNYDADQLVNSNEAALWTDPLEADTDRDGFDDDADSNALSRVFIAWGEAAYTVSNDYFYTGPTWWAGSWRSDGAWTTNPVGWQASALLSNGVGSLVIEVDRLLLTNDAVLDMDFRGGSNAILTVSLDDSNAVAVVTNLFGNLILAPDEEGQTNLVIPFATHATAARIRLQRGTGEVVVYGNLLYVDQDGDGLDEDQEAQVGSSDFDADSDEDGLADYAEVFAHGTAPAAADTDGDGVSDGAEVARGTDPGDPDSLNRTIHVDATSGSDAYDGYSATVGSGHGPRQTFGGGIGASISGDHLSLAAGTYANEPSRNFGGAKTLTVHATGNVIFE